MLIRERSSITSAHWRGVGGLTENADAADASSVQVWQLAIKDADRSWVGFKDTKGKNKIILTILLEIMYSV